MRRPLFGRMSLLSCLLLGAAVCVCTLAAISVRGNFWLVVGSRTVGIYRGVFSASWGHDRPALQIGTPGFHFRRHPAALDLWFRPSRMIVGVGSISCPAWIPAIMLSAGALGVQHRNARRRRKAECCTACGYSLRGLPRASPCPECGGFPAAKSAVESDGSGPARGPG